MKDKSTSISTQALWAQLFEAPTLDSFFAKSGEDAVLPSFADYIKQLTAEKGENAETILRRSNIESSFGHRLFNGTRNPSRDTVLQLAFGLGLTTDETQQFLKIARATALHPKVRRDAIISYCLYHRMTLIETQELLHDAGLPLLGGRKYA